MSSYRGQFEKVGARLDRAAEIAARRADRLAEERRIREEAKARRRERFARAQRYAAMMAEGATLQVIADGEGITRERVRQVLAEFPAIHANAKSRRRKLVRDAADERQRVRAHESHEQLIRHHCGKGFAYADATLDGWMTLFLLEHEPPYSSLAFKRFLDSHPDAPSAGTYQNRFGRWRAIADRYGFQPYGRDSGGPKTREQCAQAVLRVATELGRVPSIHDYDAYRRHSGGRKRRDGEPSPLTVRRLLGNGASWRGVRHWLQPRTDVPPRSTAKLEQGARDENDE